MDKFPLTRIISGGQTGVDRAALDVAIYREIPHDGWCPKGRRAEDGRIPDSYQLKENTSTNYAIRTEQNVIDSDGTLILYRVKLRGGSKLTQFLARRHNRPCLCIDLTKSKSDVASGESDATDNPMAAGVRAWIFSENISVLNIAGPRASSAPGIGEASCEFLLSVLSNVGCHLPGEQDE